MRLIQYLLKKTDYLLIAAVYLFYYFYAVTNIHEIIIPSRGTDPFAFDLVTDIILAKGVLLKGCPAYFFCPLYAYFAYMIKLLVAGNPFIYFRILIFVQVTVFFISTIYFRKLASLLFKNNVSRLAYYMYSLYPPFIFYSVLPTKTVLATACFTFFLYNFIRYIQSRAVWSIVIAGLFLGVILHFRGNCAVLIPVVCVYLVRKRAFWHSVVFLAGVIVLIAPFFLRNCLIAHEPVVLSSVGGIHLYIGNNETASGTYSVIDGVDASMFGHYFDAKRVAQQQTGSTLTDSGLNRYWKTKAYRFIITHPLNTLYLASRKIFLAVNHVMISNNYSILFFRKEYLPFAISFIPYNFAFLFVTGMLGFLYGRIRYKSLLATCFVLLWLSTAVIFIADRYRLPLTLFLMLNSIGFINGIAEKKIRITAAVISLGLIFVLITLYPAFSYDQTFMTIAYKKNAYCRNMIAKHKQMGNAEFMDLYQREKQSYARSFTSLPLLVAHTIEEH